MSQFARSLLAIACAYAALLGLAYGNIVPDMEPAPVVAVERYTLEPRTGSCYKFHLNSLPWQHAAMKCASERAHLAVINSVAEAQVLSGFISLTPTDAIISADTRGIAHIGFMEWKNTGHWLIVLGQTLEQAGFETWGADEPNYVNGDENCGSVTNIGKLNAVSCTEKNLPFICEITPQ